MIYTAVRSWGTENEYPYFPRNQMPSSLLFEDKMDICSQCASGREASYLATLYQIGSTTIRMLVSDWRPENGFPYKIHQTLKVTRVPDQDRIEICRRRIYSESYAEIAKHYDIGLTGVRSIAKDCGPPDACPFQKKHTQSKRRARISESENISIRNMAATGMTLREVADS